MRLEHLVQRITEARKPQVAIYAIRETGTGNVVYVGSTVSPLDRLGAHRASERFRGRSIEMEILTYCDESERDAVERLAIRIGQREGFPLENLMHNKVRSWEDD